MSLPARSALRALFAALSLLPGALAAQAGPTAAPAPPSPRIAPAFLFELPDGDSPDRVAPLRARLEANAARIISDLGVDCPSAFTVYLWKDRATYLERQEKDIGRKYPSSVGYAIGSGAIGLLDFGDPPATAVHEFAHCMSVLLQPSFGNNPRWLWEAVALYEAGDFHEPARYSYLREGRFPSLEELNGDLNKGNFLIYDVGYTLVAYVIDGWGREGLRSLVRGNGNVSGVLGVSEEDFEAGWKTFVLKTYGLSPSR